MKKKSKEKNKTCAIKVTCKKNEIFFQEFWRYLKHQCKLDLS